MTVSEFSQIAGYTISVGALIFYGGSLKQKIDNLVDIVKSFDDRLKDMNERFMKQSSEIMAIQFKLEQLKLEHNNMCYAKPRERESLHKVHTE